MKHIVIFSLSFTSFFLIHSNAQDFDAGLEKIAAGISQKIDSKEKTKVAVWGFFTESGETTALGNYITEDFSVYLTNSGENFQVIDRNHLDVLLQEHQLNAEGYIDGETAKELGKITAVDAVITGTYTVLNSVVKVRAKVLDTETALQFAANMGNLPLNENISSYLGISINGGNTTNKGFNAPLNSKETINSPETVDPKCAEEGFGDYCFSNAINEKLIVKIRYGGHYKIIYIDPGETKCLYEFESGIIEYQAVTWSTFEKELDSKIGRVGFGNYAAYSLDKGELKVEVCKSKTYTIK